MVFSSCILGSDHAGFALRRFLSEKATSLGMSCTEVGAESADIPFDYPLCVPLIEEALSVSCMGVLICGSGIGMSMAANRHPLVRAALCHDVSSARLARAHNNANVLVLGSRFIGTQVAADCLEAFVQTPFEGGRHQTRVSLFSPPS